MTHVRSEDNVRPVGVSRPRVAAVLLSLHGFVLAVASSARDTSSPWLAGAVVVVTSVPWVLWATGYGPLARRPPLSFGVIPASWLLAGAAFENFGPGADVSRVVLVATGVLAHLAAASVMDTRESTAEALVVQPTGRMVSSGTLRRARLRAFLLGVLGLTFAALIVHASAFHENTSRLERTFAVVITSVLATSVLLVMVPETLRRSRRTLPSMSARVTGAVVAVVGAALAMGLEYATR